MYVWVSVTTPLYRIAQPSLWFLATLLAGLLSSTATTEGEDRCEIMKFVSLISRQWCHVYVSNGTYIYIYNQHTSQYSVHICNANGAYAIYLLSCEISIHSTTSLVSTAATSSEIFLTTRNFFGLLFLAVDVFFACLNGWLKGGLRMNQAQQRPQH